MSEQERKSLYADPPFWVAVYSSYYDEDPSLWCYHKLQSPDKPDGMPACITIQRATWRHRDEIDGTAKQPVVWSQQSWWRERKSIWRDHGVRPSVKHPGLLAYYQSADKACRGILTPIKPGRYLAKFFSDILSEKERARLAKWQETGSFPSEYTDAAKYPLSFAKSAGEMVAVYLNGPSSCMSHEAGDYETDGTHPVKVYAAGDLKIAYLTDAENDKVRARTLCWPERKIFGRVYPTECYWNDDGFASSEDAESMQSALRNRLLADGYAQDSGSSFNGARLRRIELDDDRIVMPYLDGRYKADERGNHLIMLRNGDIECDQTDGTATIKYLGATCDRCEDHVDEYSTHTVYLRATARGGRNEQSWCEHCAESHTFRCAGHVEYFDEDVPSVDVDGDTYTLAYAEEHFTRSDYSGDYFSGDSVDVINRNGTEQWSSDEFADNGFVCAISGDNYAIDYHHPDHTDIGGDIEQDQIDAWLAEQPTINDERQINLPETAQ